MAYNGPVVHNAIVCWATPQICLTLLAGLDFQRLRGTQNALSSTGTPGRRLPKVTESLRSQLGAPYNSVIRQGWSTHRFEASKEAVKLVR